MRDVPVGGGEEEWMVWGRQGAAGALAVLGA